MDCLPIDEVLSDIGCALATAPAAVLEAPPGAGKTTRVPRYLCQQTRGEVLVSEPRRLAAKLAALRVAEECGERVGQSIGYSVRLEQVVGPETRVTYMTDGVLLKRLLSDSNLSKVSFVVLDEFHERHLNSDLSLMLLRRLQERRPDLKLLVMSATLDAASVAEYLGDCIRIRSEGRSYQLDITHQRRPDDRPLDKQVASAVRQLLATTAGDILVFLPGAAEIRRTKSALQQLAIEHDLLLAPLHGELPLDQQTRAVRRQPQRKVILSTNVAESSVTVEHVTGVVDTGVARVLLHDAWSGMDRLGITKISQASATQRAGRAGRTADGQVIRLFTRGDFEARPQNDTPEIERLDLCEALLVLKSANLNDLDTLPWLTAPPESSLSAAEALLAALGAVGTDGALTPLGHRLLDFPLHPRLARVIVEAEQRGVGREGCVLAALLSERDIRARTRGIESGQQLLDGDADSDVLELLELFRTAEDAGFDKNTLRQLEVEPNALNRVRLLSRRLWGLLHAGPSEPATLAERDEALLIALMTGFIDRLAQRTPPNRSLLLANGKVAELAEESVVKRAPLMVAITANERAQHGRRGHVLVRQASRVDEQWLFDLYIDRLQESDELEFNEGNERVERVRRIRLGRLTLDETRSVAEPGPTAREILFRRAMIKGAHNFDRDDALAQLLARIELLGEYQHTLPEQLSRGLSLEDVLRLACQSAVSLAQLRTAGLESALWEHLPTSLMADLDRQVPTELTLPSGRRLKVHYARGAAPYVESRLQDFFSMTETPSICGGRHPLLLHLLAPNRRAVQVTRDLAGFWDRHYPALRKQLMRRYPRHSWPEDGRTAPPPATGSGRRSGRR